MNCYMCDGAGRETAAVAICSNCGVALCRQHLDEDLLGARVHGLVRRGCTHGLPHDARARRLRPPLPDESDWPPRAARS